jgi:hypothetical protein
MSLVLQFIIDAVLGMICCWTGEIILFILSLGKHKPRWDWYTEEKSTIRFVMFSEISTWIGMTFWFAVLVLVIKLLILK